MTEFTQCQKDALDVSRSVGVTASAGTGKTFLLQNRFVKLLVEKDVRPNQILCLTYTEKAAAEMQDKIEQELRKQSDAEVKRRMDGGMTREEAEENKLTWALGSIHQCTINTFHGFCSGLLHEFPIEADIPISYSIMDSLADHDLVMSAIADTLNHPDETLWEHVTVLFRNFSDERKLASAVKIFLYAWETYAPWFDYLKEHPEDVISEWNAWKTELIETSWQNVVDDPKLRAYNAIENTNKRSMENAQKTREIYQRLSAASTLEEKRLCLKEFAEQKSPTGVIYDGLDKHYEEVRGRMGKIIDSAVVFAADDVNWQRMVSVLLAFGAVTAHVHAVIRERKREGGYLDFADLISHVEYLLDHNENIRRELCARYRYILVDEVQDNDPILTRLVRILAEDTKTNDKLFAVGDMKQAIYGFRGADPAGFTEILGDFGQDPVELNVNYRTVPFLIDAVNT
ncbi:MAG TPA: UvrD-helicase domain-containing protein, partial [Methanocorpusculum sp.]|nr:UvrD-helicase domain-containing protein [Methanocorpusculum sp.]